MLTGTLAWAPHVGAGTAKGREAQLRVEGQYLLAWRDFSQVTPEPDGRFRFLTISVEPSAG